MTALRIAPSLIGISGEMLSAIGPLSSAADAYAVMASAIGDQVAYWRCGSTATLRDVIGTRHGNFSGPPPARTEGLAPDTSDGALQFSNQVASVPHDAGLALAKGAIAFWVKVLQDPLPDAILIAKGPWFVAFRAGEIGTAFVGQTGTARAAALDQAYHVAVTWGAFGLSLWIDGREIGTDPSFAGGWTDNTSPIRFAGDIEDTATSCVLDEITLYSSVPSVAELVELATIVDDPVVQNLGPFDAPEGATTSIDLLAGATWAGSFAGLTVEIVAKTSVTGAGHDVTINSATKRADFAAGATTGDDVGLTFTYRITDAVGLSNTGTVTVDVRDADVVIAGDPDLTHDLFSAGKLKFYVGSHPNAAAQLGKERVVGATITPFGSANFAAVHPDRPTWRCFASAATNAGASIALASTALDELGASYSIWMDVDFTSHGAWEALFAVPWAAVHGTPASAFVLQRNSTTSQLQHRWTEADTTHRIHTGVATSYPAATGRMRIAATRSGTRLRFFLAGAQVGADITVGANAPGWAQTSQPVALFARSSTDPSTTSVQGKLVRMFLVDYELSPTQISALESIELAMLGATTPDPGASYVSKVQALSPAFYVPFSETSGSTAIALAGPNWTYAAIAQRGVTSLVTGDATGRSVGAPGTGFIASAPSPIAGPDLTIDFPVQFDTLDGTQIMISKPGNTGGEFSVEKLPGGQMRAFSYASGGVLGELLGTVGDAQQGTVHKITYQRQSGVSPSQRLFVDGVEVAADATIRTWPPVPAGLVYAGAWSNGTAALDGLLAHVAGWNRYLADAEIAGLVQVEDSVCWAEDFGAGGVSASTSVVVSALQAGWHGRAPIVVTAGDGVNGRVTTQETGSDITITAGASIGDDSFSYQLTDNNGNVSSSSTVSVSVATVASANDHDAAVMGAPGQISNAALFASDVYYWSGGITDAIRDGWNNAIVANRNNFATAHPLITQNINSKTFISNRAAPYHESVITPAVPFADEVLVTPALSNSGVLRATSRNKTGWDPVAGAAANFRKHLCTVRRRDPHPAYDLTAHPYYDILSLNQTYESGFTFWQGGTTAFFEGNGLGGATAIMQVHGQQAAIYFQVSSSGVFGGFTRPSPTGAQQSFTGFNMTTGYDDIHVLKFSFRLGTGGHFRVWYNGVLRVDVSRTIDPGAPRLQDIGFLYKNPWLVDSSTGLSPSVAGGSVTEPTIYIDRIWRAAV